MTDDRADFEEPPRRPPPSTASASGVSPGTRPTRRGRRHRRYAPRRHVLRRHQHHGQRVPRRGATGPVSPTSTARSGTAAPCCSSPCRSSRTVSRRRHGSTPPPLTSPARCCRSRCSASTARATTTRWRRTKCGCSPRSSSCSSSGSLAHLGTRPPPRASRPRFAAADRVPVLDEHEPDTSAGHHCRSTSAACTHPGCRPLSPSQVTYTMRPDQPSTTASTRQRRTQSRARMWSFVATYVPNSPTVAQGPKRAAEAADAGGRHPLTPTFQRVCPRRRRRWPCPSGGAAARPCGQGAAHRAGAMLADPGRKCSPSGGAGAWCAPAAPRKAPAEAQPRTARSSQGAGRLRSSRPLRTMLPSPSCTDPRTIGVPPSARTRLSSSCVTDQEVASSP